MNAKRPVGLGKNLSALLGTPLAPLTQGENLKSTHTLPMHQLLPGKYQPRRQFDETRLQALSNSIQQQGLLQPLIVRPLGEGKFEILAGERRWRACQLAGLKDIPVVVKTVSDEEAMVIALVENLQREDLNVLEQARGMSRLMQEFSLTHQQVADVLQQSRSAVSNVLRLLNLSPSVQVLLEQGELDMGHARSLLMLDEQEQIQVAHDIVNKKLSVRATENLVSRLKTAGDKQPIVLDPDTLLSAQCYQKSLVSLLKTKVEIKPGRRTGAGKLVIHYDNEKLLENLVDLLS